MTRRTFCPGELVTLIQQLKEDKYPCKLCGALFAACGDECPYEADHTYREVRDEILKVYNSGRDDQVKIERAKATAYWCDYG